MFEKVVIGFVVICILRRLYERKGISWITSKFQRDRGPTVVFISAQDNLVIIKLGSKLRALSDKNGRTIWTREFYDNRNTKREPLRIRNVDVLEERGSIAVQCSTPDNDYESGFFLIDLKTGLNLSETKSDPTDSLLDKEERRFDVEDPAEFSDWKNKLREAKLPRGMVDQDRFLQNSDRVFLVQYNPGEISEGSRIEAYDKTSQKLVWYAERQLENRGWIGPYDGRDRVYLYNDKLYVLSFKKIELISTSSGDVLRSYTPRKSWWSGTRSMGPDDYFDRGSVYARDSGLRKRLIKYDPFK